MLERRNRRGGPSGRFLNWHKIPLSLIGQWCRSACCSSDLFESLGSENFLSGFVSSEFAPLNALCVRLDVRIQQMFELVLQFIRDDRNEVCAKLFGYELHKLMTVLSDELHPLVQARREVIHGSALGKVLQSLSATCVD